MGGAFYSFNKDNTLTAVDLKTGQLIYSKVLDTKGSLPLSVTFENGNAYFIVRPEYLEQKQAVLPINLNDPSCSGELTPLEGYDKTSLKTRVRRLGDSSMVVTSILPTSSDTSIECDGHQATKSIGTESLSANQ